MANQMYRVLLIITLFSACLSSCTKTNDEVAVINAQEVKDDQLINKYLTTNSIKANEVDSAGVSTGIYYTVDSVGAGNALFTNSTTITVSYTGWLLNANAALGPVIAQSYQPKQSVQYQPSFILGEVLRGWQLGIESSVPVIGNGGAITLYLPSKYAYGPFPQSTLGLAANSVLIFHIVLYNVTN